MADPEAMTLLRLQTRTCRVIAELTQLIDDAESYAENRGVPCPIDTAELRRERVWFQAELAAMTAG